MWEEIEERAKNDPDSFADLRTLLILYTLLRPSDNFGSSGGCHERYPTGPATLPNWHVNASGSIRPGSYTTLAVALALTGAEELKCESKLI